MEVRTFTSFWNMERKLYTLQDIALPVPISLRVVGVFLLVAIPWWILFFNLGVPLENGFFIMLWIGPPAGLGYLATKPIFQGKTIFEFARSMFLYLIQPKKLFGLRAPQFNQNKYRIVGRIFTRDLQLTTKQERPTA